MGKLVTGYRAWLVRWEWFGGHARKDDPIIAVLSSQFSEKEVTKFVERFYAATMYTPAEMLTFMRDPRLNPYRATQGTTTIIQESGEAVEVPYSGRIFCGHNPHIVATQVRDLRSTEEVPGLTWIELPVPTIDFSGRGRAD